MFESWQCVLYTSAAYTRVFTVRGDLGPLGNNQYNYSIYFPTRFPYKIHVSYFFGNLNLIGKKISKKGDGLMATSLIDFSLSRLFHCPNLSVSCCPSKGCQPCLIHSINICSCRKKNSLIYQIWQIIEVESLWTRLWPEGREWRTGWDPHLMPTYLDRPISHA